MKHSQKPAPAAQSLNRAQSANSDGHVTIIDVARRAGVSYATVSRVINNEAYVKEATRQRVQQALADLGYVANRQARSLRGGRTQMIGLLVRDFDSGYIGEIIRGIDRELHERHYDLVLYTTHGRGQRESDYVATLMRGMVDGLLLVLPSTPEAYLAKLRQAHFPHVLIDHQGIDTAGPAVGATNWQGGHDATAYLLGLGHRRIGLITGNLGLGCAVDRRAGYCAALEAYGVALDPALIAVGDFTQSAGYKGAKELLTLAHPPTAIFASNDMMAFGAMEAVREQGLRIPEDLSILGFDDIPQTAGVHPPLTTMRQPLEEMGRVATQMLFTYLEDPHHIEERRALSTQLIIRQSCQAPPLSNA
ncbi:MAG: LacI family DNA-binding transcriptional regulator [Caldilineaceae bacterium]|nr:LacI family DNA-binding transcriptional regulator [Caldilineaceae bacterium]